MAAALPTQRFAPFFPAWLRAFVRTREIGLALAAVGIGAVSGLLVAGMGAAAQGLHELLFGVPRGLRLSVEVDLSPWRVLIAPAAGGVVLSGLAAWAGGRFRGKLSDAIEANALHGGRMSLWGSLYISIQTVLSNGFGASVGLEAGYTQIGSGFASLIGRGLAARRSDMRLLVACGAAGAIAAAFGAPLTGSFYAFELVLGAYSVGALAPVVASAVVANFVDGALTEHSYLITSGPLVAIGPQQFVHVGAIALLCAAGGVLVMQGVAFFERVFANSGLPPWLRPIVGGAMVGGLGLIAPQVLGAGHGALQTNLLQGASIYSIATLVALKMLASSISLGSGFRGGLFFASLLLGSLTGRLYAELIAAFTPYHIDAGTAAIAGMAAFGTGVLGAPVTMTVLALESTGDFSVTMAAVVACAITALVVRETFGYSFATWRFHLRGETIRGPHDVGWVRDMKVSRLMLKDARTVSNEMSISAARGIFPPGSVKQIVALDGQGRYAGMVMTADLHAAAPEDLSHTVMSLAQEQEAWLLPDMTIKEALGRFERTESDALVVLDSETSQKVIGVLTEAHALRRYGEELERRSREIVFS
jgi:chloride channel protein, CIC family